MENYVRIYATNIKIRKAQTKEKGGGENRKEKQKQKFKTTMKNVLVGGVT